MDLIAGHLVKKSKKPDFISGQNHVMMLSLCKNSRFKLRKYLFRYYPTIICQSLVYIFVNFFKSVIFEVCVRDKSFALRMFYSLTSVSVCICSTLWLIYTVRFI